MDAEGENDDFHRSLEPVIIIDDEDSDDEFYENNSGYNDPEQDPLSIENSLPEYVKRMGPDISITPVWKTDSEPRLKIRLFEKEYSPSKDDHNDKVYSAATITRTREKVRKISKDEASNAEDTYTRRKSNPLKKCPVCKKYFRRMQTHMLQHEMSPVNSPVDERLVCTLCQKAFNTPSNLAIHMRSHTGDKPYVCEICDKSFSQSCNLVNHKRVHTGEKPYKCPHCDRAFTQSGNLNNHIRLHTDEKPFKCHFCDRAFAQSGNLSSHIRNNHKVDYRFSDMFA